MRRSVCVALLALPAAFPAHGMDRGQQLFEEGCISCHSLDPDNNMVGPSLSGLWGRKAGGLPSFTRYSPAMRAADAVWADDTLDQFLADPQALIPENHMAFPGMDDPQARADLIGFLKQAAQSNPR
jgi:cytochrome c